MTKHIGFKRTKIPACTAETKAEYAAEEAKYFGAYGDAKRPGLSATDAAMVDPHLPSKQKEHEMLEHWEKNLTKASRSGAFSKPNVGPAIFPQGIKKTMEFIDSVTPGHYKEQKERPVPREMTRKPDVPPADATITHLCIDCLELVNQNDASSIIPVMFIMTDPDPHRLFAMGVRPGSIVLAVEHRACARKAKQEQQSRIVLVRGGNLTSPDDLARAAKYGMIERMHDGHEFTVGQFHEMKRRDRLESQLGDILICMDKTSLCYHKNRQKARERGEIE